MANLKETTEFFDAFFATVAQGIKSFEDGVQLLDIADFFDEALIWQRGVQGFAEAFGPEAVEADLGSIHDLFSKYELQLASAGLDPVLAAAAATGAKGFYLTFAAVKRGQARKEEAENQTTT